MTLDELMEFIDKEDNRIREHYGNPPKKERILARTVKLMEESGELANEILKTLSMQRNSKLNNSGSKELSEEFADVIITTLLLAKSSGVDIRKSLDSKIEKINKRNYKE